MQEALVRAMSQRTVLMIAHRLSTVARAHKIIVLHGGCVVETVRPRTPAAAQRPLAPP